MPSDCIQIRGLFNATGFCWSHNSNYKTTFSVFLSVYSVYIWNSFYTTRIIQIQWFKYNVTPGLKLSELLSNKATIILPHVINNQNKPVTGKQEFLVRKLDQWHLVLLTTPKSWNKHCSFIHTGTVHRKASQWSASYRRG